MTEAPNEPSEPTADQDEDGPEKQPDLPDPSFTEVLPGGEDAPGSASEPDEHSDKPDEHSDDES